MNSRPGLRRGRMKPVFRPLLCLRPSREAGLGALARPARLRFARPLLQNPLPALLAAGLASAKSNPDSPAAVCTDRPAPEKRPFLHFNASPEPWQNGGWGGGRWGARVGGRDSKALQIPLSKIFGDACVGLHFGGAQGMVESGPLSLLNSSVRRRFTCHAFPQKSPRLRDNGEL